MGHHVASKHFVNFVYTEFHIAAHRDQSKRGSYMSEVMFLPFIWCICTTC